MSQTMNRSILHENRSLVEHFERPRVLLSVLSALTLAVYWVSVSFQFVWDDVFQIIDNPLVHSWRNLPQVFLNDLWFHMQRGQLYYRPMFTTWSMLNYSLFHLDPRGWHLAAILLHIATVWSVYLLARKLRMNYWVAALGAAIFALHPIHIEAVSWISAASDSMVTLFYVTAFAAFISSEEAEEPRQRTRWRLLSLAFLTVALLTKEMAVTFFVVAGLYTFLWSKSSGTLPRLQRAVSRTWPYAFITLGYLVLRKAALHDAAAAIAKLHSTIMTDLSYGVGDHTIPQSVITLPYVVAYYIRLLIFPKGLTALYYTPYLKMNEWWISAGAIAILACFALLLWYWKKRKNDKLPVFLGLWALLTLAPALYLSNFSNGDFVRDRYAYLPSVGFLLLAASAIRLLPSLAFLSAFRVQAAAATIVLVSISLGAEQQIYWADELALFQRGHDLYPDSVYASLGLARMLGRAHANDRALEILKQTIAEHPKNVGSGAYFLLSEAYSRAGDKAAAKEALARALATMREPITGELELADLAGFLGRVGDYDQATRVCDKLLEKAPDLLSAVFNCGNVQLQAGHPNEAAELLAKAVALAPTQSDPVFWLGRAYLQAGRVPEAKEAFQKAISLNENVPEYRYWMNQAEQAASNPRSSSTKQIVNP
jgi:tetratricopeptide (TPR) repeat protein